MRCSVVHHRGSAVGFDPADPPTGFPPDLAHFSAILHALRDTGAADGLELVVSWVDRPWRADFGERAVVIYVGRETPRVPTYLGEAWLAFSNMATTPTHRVLRRWPGSVGFAASLGARLAVNTAAYAVSRRYRTRPYLDIPLGRQNAETAPWVEPEQRGVDVSFIGSAMPGARRRQRIGPKAVGRRLAVRHAEVAAGRRSDLRFDLEVVRTFGQRTVGYSVRSADARVMLCPIGSTTETSRFEEALSFGAVPIAFPQPKRAFFAAHPGVELADWSELPETLDVLFADRDALHDRMRRCRAFYEEHFAPPAVAASIAAAIASRRTDDRA